MNKKEKYINYVVEDLISNTEIYYDQEIIKLPFLTPPFLSFFLLPPSSFFSSYFPFFSNHVIKVYGAHSEEINIIWNLYKDRLHSLIKK